ncbi:MAG: flavodoxin family protein [Candidatus Zixiibacteriota bacterium]|nr:MAG: flavodoxin family protein [candidate division Zixibacteria bacterium]
MSSINILCISGSPVEGSSTDFILRRLAAEIGERLTPKIETRISFVKLSNTGEIACQACGKAPEEEFCIYHDLDETYSLLEKCDCLLFGSPVYFDSVSAQAKLFIDRCNCFRPADFNAADDSPRFIRLLERRRPGVIVLVGSEGGWFEGARRVVAGFFKWVEVVNEGVITYNSPDLGKKGTAAGDEATLRWIAERAEHVASILKCDVEDR